MELDIFTGTLLVGIVQTLLLSLSLFIKPSPLRTANRYLATLLMTCGLALLVHLLTVTHTWQQMTLIYLLLSTVIFAIGPNLYFYVCQLTLTKKITIKEHTFHYIPMILNIIYLVAVYGHADIRINHPQQSEINLVAWLLPICKVLSLGIYSVLSIRCLLGHTQRVRQLFSNLGNKSLNWLRNLIFCFMTLVLLFTILFLFQVDLDWMTGSVDTVLSAIIIVMIFMTGLYGLNQPEIFSEQLVSLTKPVVLSDIKVKKSDSEFASELDIRLTSLVEDYSLFEDHFLDLKKMAQALSMTPHQLSSYLNNERGTNFYEFVSLQRIRRVQTLLLCSDDAILDIALRAGFSNKATFNSAFKKHVKMTPSQYRKAHS